MHHRFSISLALVASLVAPPAYALYAPTFQPCDSGAPDLSDFFVLECSGCHHRWDLLDESRGSIAAIIDRVSRPAGAAGSMPRLMPLETGEDSRAQIVADLQAWQAAGLPGSSMECVPTIVYRPYWSAGSEVAPAGYTYRYIRDAFAVCASCHSGTFPDYLRFDASSALRMNSYYLPGATKAEASLLRTIDGTMPPGEPARTAFDNQVRAAITDWINNGFRETP